MILASSLLVYRLSSQVLRCSLGLRSGVYGFYQPALPARAIPGCYLNTSQAAAATTWEQQKFVVSRHAMAVLAVACEASLIFVAPHALNGAVNVCYTVVGCTRGCTSDEVGEPSTSPKIYCQNSHIVPTTSAAPMLLMLAAASNGGGDMNSYSCNVISCGLQTTTYTVVGDDSGGSSFVCFVTVGRQVAINTFISVKSLITITKTLNSIET
jgi:hypothetical protein